MSNTLALTHIDQSLACPLALVAFSSIMEEINHLWEEAYAICKSDVKSLARTAYTLHLNYLTYMKLVCHECIQGRNSLENIHTELKIALATGELDQVNAFEITESANKLLDVFKSLSDQNKVIKKDIDDCKNNIEEREKSFSKQTFTSTIISKLSLLTHARNALFGVAAGVTVTELFSNTVENPIILGFSASILAVLGSSAVCKMSEPTKIARLRVILETLKLKIGVLFDHVDNLGFKITEMVSELEVYTENTERCFGIDDENLLTGERMNAKCQSLVESTLALKLSFNQMGDQAKEHSRYIRAVIKLGKTTDLIEH